MSKQCPVAYQPASDLLKGRVILVTGAGRGIGRSAAIHFAKFGATVVLLGKTIAHLEQTYDEILAQGSPQPALYPLNLAGANNDDYLQLAETLHSEFGQLDGLLHNAAQLGAPAPIEHYDVATWHEVMQANLNGPFMLTRSCLPLLRRSTDPSIVFTTDQPASTSAYWGAYRVSKCGIEGMAQLLANECDTQQPIRVNTINPGAVRTDLRIRAYPGEPARNFAQPDTLMPTYLYLMGPDSKGNTGQLYQC